MKLRIGRIDLAVLYLQRGEEPSDADPRVGECVDFHTSLAICKIVNGTRLSEPTWEHLDDMARMANWIEGGPRKRGD